MPPVFALSCCIQSLKYNRAIQSGSMNRQLENCFCGLLSGKKSQIWWILNCILCVCICDCDWFVFKVGKAAISCWVGDMKAVRFLCPLKSQHKCTKLSPPYHGRKTPTTNKKSLLSAVHCIRWNPPRREKWAGREKKSLLSPTNTSWSPGQSWNCMGLPDNWALSRQKPMLHSPDRNSVNPQPLILTPPLARRSHTAPNNQVTALIVTIIQHLHS